MIFNNENVHLLSIFSISFWDQINNRTFEHSLFDSKIIHFYMSYFPYNGQTGILSSKTKEQDNEFENNFLIICRYLNLVKKISEANFIANKKFTICYNITISSRLWETIYVIFICMKGDLLPVLKGNNSCKTYNFIIKVEKCGNGLMFRFIHDIQEVMDGDKSD